LAEIRVDAAAWERLVREIILAVEALHSTGIVHGAIHERNVIVGDDGAVKLTHVSPLLYSDSQVDATDVIEMLDELVGAQAPESDLAKLLHDARAEGWPLGEVYRRMGEMGVEPVTPRKERAEPKFRIGAIVAAVVVASVGVAVAAGVMWYLGDWPIST
jgi:hypothetical protein